MVRPRTRIYFTACLSHINLHRSTIIIIRISDISWHFRLSWVKSKILNKTNYTSSCGINLVQTREFDGDKCTCLFNKFVVYRVLLSTKDSYISHVLCLSSSCICFTLQLTSHVSKTSRLAKYANYPPAQRFYIPRYAALCLTRWYSMLGKSSLKL